MQVNRRILYTPALATGSAVVTPYPATVTTAFWYDASNAASITQSGGTVSQWNDLSGNARHLTQSTTANQPTYATGIQNGLPAIHFVNTTSGATSSSMETASFTQAQIFTIMVVFKTTGITYDTSGSLGSNALIIDGDPVAGAGGNRLTMFAALGSGSANFGGGTGVNTSVTLAANTAYHWGATLNGVSSGDDLNGTAVSGSNAGVGGIVSGIIIPGTSSTLFIDMYICEMFCIPNTSGVLAAIDLANSISYVSGKWGV